MLLRLDSLANILAWTKTNPHKGGHHHTGVAIDVIELPRLFLTFEKITIGEIFRCLIISFLLIICLFIFIYKR